MMGKRHVVCLAGILAILAAPAVFAAGTPNLGSPAVLGQGSAFGVDVRAFDPADDQDTLDNAVWSLGYTGSVNEKLDFSLWYSKIDVLDQSIEEGEGYYLSDLTIQRKVLAPSLKWLLSSPEASAQTALTLGADVVLDDNTVTLRDMWLVQGSTERMYFDDFVPAVRLQSMWGKPGKLQYQLAAQVNFFDNVGRYLGQYEPSPNQYSYGPDAPGTVLGLGGGIIWPLSSRLTVVGDFMGVVDGYNSHCTICGEAHRQANIWSAGLNYACKGSDFSVYATNSLAPTLVDSLMASPGEITAVAARWGTSW